MSTATDPRDRIPELAQDIDRLRELYRNLKVQKTESPQMRVGSGGASSMPPQQRNSIEINAPGEWKP